jgi:predicted metal-binding membrane protein
MWLSAAILIAAGIYQLSPLKEACLAHCRSPAQFLSRHFRPGPTGAFRLGVIHGAFCLGCCWLLMALLFVGGVMNLAWIALLSLLVAGEKLLPGGRLLALAAGLGFIVWGALIAFL